LVIFLAPYRSGIDRFQEKTRGREIGIEDYFFCWLSGLGPALEACVLLQKCQWHLACWSISLFRYNQFGNATKLLLCSLVGLVEFRAHQKSDDIRILP
jgi:hypothetical protein